MELIILILGPVALLFGMVLLSGAPYLPTLPKQIETALDMLDLKKGQTLLELGSGDGRVLKAAAKRGYKTVGYEINPLLVIASKLHTWQYRSNVKIIWANYWGAKWPKTDGIYVFLLDKYMDKLNNKVIQNYPARKIKLVSYAFQIKSKKPVESNGALYLYEYNR